MRGSQVSFDPIVIDMNAQALTDTGRQRQRSGKISLSEMIFILHNKRKPRQNDGVCQQSEGRSNDRPFRTVFRSTQKLNWAPKSAPTTPSALPTLLRPNPPRNDAPPPKS